jgi:hypothetical protein
MIGKVGPRGCRVAGLLYYCLVPAATRSTPIRIWSLGGVIPQSWNRRCA